MKIAEIQVTPVHQERWGDDLDVVNAARVSFAKESTWVWDDEYLEYMEGELKPQDIKLIQYLAKHKHFSPFNHSFITVRVKAPIFVARQLVKHKFMPWNEVSRRYVDDEPEFYMTKEWRGKPLNVKQGSDGRCEAMYENADKDWMHEDIAMPLDDQAHLLLSNTVLLYNEMVEKGCAPEQARMILPQNMMTEWIWSGTLGAFADMLRLRLDPHTQYESQIVAKQILPLIQASFPVSIQSLLENK